MSTIIMRSNLQCPRYQLADALQDLGHVPKSFVQPRKVVAWMGTLIALVQQAEEGFAFRLAAEV